MKQPGSPKRVDVHDDAEWWHFRTLRTGIWDGTLVAKEGL